MYHPPDLGCSRVEKRVFSFFFEEKKKKKKKEGVFLALFRNRWVGCRLLRVGCQFQLYQPFVEKLYIFFLVSFSKSRKRKKEKTMNINSKRKKNPGKEIKHLLFFIVGKVAILSTFFDWRKSMYCTLKFEH